MADVIRHIVNDSLLLLSRMKKIILASGSPRRKNLFEWAELPFEVIVSNSDESFDEADAPADVALNIAKKKNQAVAEMIEDRRSSSVVISADTIVVLENKVIGKPKDRNEAIDILKRLSGQTHSVITAVCITDDKIEHSFYDTTYVSFYDLSEEQIVHYVDHYKPYDKAGAYAIQEWIGVVGIRSIEGDFYNVMGLPISRVVNILNKEFFIF